MNWKQMLEQGNLGPGDLASEKALASALKVSEHSLQVYRKKGLPYYRIGGMVWYLVPEVVLWILTNCRRTMDSDETYQQLAAHGREVMARRRELEGAEAKLE